MQFKKFAQYLQKLEETTKRLEITAILKDLIEKLDAEETPKALYLASGYLKAPFENEKFNIAEKMMVRILTQAYATPKNGLTEEEIPVEFTGVRPGEKLFEELATAGEEMAKTRHPKIFIGKFESFSMRLVEEALQKLAGISESMSRTDIRATLGTIVPEMRIPEGESDMLSSSPPGPVTTLH